MQGFTEKGEEKFKFKMKLDRIELLSSRPLLACEIVPRLCKNYNRRYGKKNRSISLKECSKIYN